MSLTWNENVTHWEGCWKEHPECADAEIKILEDEIRISKKRLSAIESDRVELINRINRITEQIRTIITEAPI